MFAVLVPAALAPLIVTLAWAERKAKKLGLVPDIAPSAELAPKVNFPVVRKAWSLFEQLDIFGLALIGTSVALILLPLTLAESAKNGWKNRECPVWICLNESAEANRRLGIQLR